jgi:hypothetical protein
MIFTYEPGDRVFCPTHPIQDKIFTVLKVHKNGGVNLVDTDSGETFFAGKYQVEPTKSTLYFALHPKHAAMRKGAK